MTDKPIIIDGVDVTKCRFYKAGICILSYAFVEEGYNCIICEDCPNCNYKQLQRKTAEYEELKKNNDFADVVLQRKLDKLMNKNNRLEEELNQIKLLLEGKNNQYNAKQQECEELKKALAIKTGKDYINEIQDIQMKYECHQKSLGMCWWGKYGKETECIGIRECHKKELEVIKNLEHKLQIATEALGLILNGYGNDELDLENDHNPIRIADEALEQIGEQNEAK